MTRRLPSRPVRRLVLWGGPTLCVLAVYALVKAVSSLAGERQPAAVAWLAAAALVAFVVSAARPLFERLADRLAYGPEEDPYAVMTRFVQRIADALAVDDVLPDLARTASDAVHGSGSQVRLWLADGGEWRQTWPPGRGEVAGPVSVALEHGGSPIGRLDVEVADDLLSVTDRALLDRLAGPAGLALSNVRLTYELRRRLRQVMELTAQLRLSRERLVEARGAQRQWFARAVEKRVQARLAAADSALAAASPDPAAALGTAGENVLAALESLRDLAVGIFPPALADRGLGAALELHLADAAGAVLREDGLADARFPFAVEAAGYFCCVALVEDLARHGPVTVELTPRGRALRVGVRSPGPPAPETEQLIRDRVDALGGSLQVCSPGDEEAVVVWLPTEEPGLGVPPAGDGRPAELPGPRTGGRP